MQGSSFTSWEDEENVALISKGKEFKKGPKKGGAKQQDGQKKDLSTVKCFACHKLGHYVGQCPQKKKKKQQLQQRLRSLQLDLREFSLCAGHVDRERTSIITSADIDIERTYSLLTGHSFSASTTSTWYIDSGASSHMAGAREMFFKLSHVGIDVEIVLGDDIVVKVVRRGTISERVHESHDFEGCIVCTLAKEELDISFHDRG